MSADPSRPIRGYVHHLFADRWDSTCRGRYIVVTFHPTAWHLRAAAIRHNARVGSPQPDDGYDDACGMFQPCAYRSRYDRRAKAWIDTTPACAGILRLAMTHLTTEVIAHESTHAAIHLKRLHHWSKPDSDPVCDLGDGCDAAEEAFAYLLGSLVASVNDLVHEAQRRARPPSGVGGGAETGPAGQRR